MKKIDNKPVTQQQIKMLHTLYRSNGMSDDDKRTALLSVTAGRTDSTKELTLAEARTLIHTLQKDDVHVRLAKVNAARQHLRAIRALSFEISFLNKGYKDDTSENAKMNTAKINIFFRRQFKKEITRATVDELENFKKQLQSIYNKEQRNDKKD